jgi:two-component system, NtrC family, nitrogen regulation sensor histidine kinase NtrY
MKRKLLYGLGVLLLGVLVAMLVMQGSFSLGNIAPQGPGQVYIFWAVSTLVFLLTVLIGFILFRTFLKIYLERQRNREGSRLRTKLVLAALGISLLPVFFFAVFSIYVLNRNLDKWFSQPAVAAKASLVGITMAIERAAEGKARAQAEMLAARPELLGYVKGDEAKEREVQRFCQKHGIADAFWDTKDGKRLLLCSVKRTTDRAQLATVRLPEGLGSVGVRALLEVNAEAEYQRLVNAIAQYDQMAVSKRELWQFYLQMIALICLFILFLATWAATILARQISVPIAELLKGAKELREGNLTYRLETKASDELATLVRGFNDMTQALEANDRELERRRRFTEALLENIPTGVVSLSPEGRVLRVNRALRQIFPEVEAEKNLRIEDLFPAEEAGEVRYMMKRARRTGLVTRQFEFVKGRQTMHLGVTVSTVDDKPGSPTILVIEDTGELLRAQKQAAWHEVARRVAHEIKNPLTPIALSAERIGRHLDRLGLAPENAKVLRECSAMISREVESVRALVDEFSQFARFPATQLAPVQLNDVVGNALAVFRGRLSGIEIEVNCEAGLPEIEGDGEQLKRVVVNLVDNAAEALQESALKRISVSTAALGNESVELIISDTGCGVSPEDREKLFLPYFSTKGRGTGLGLAIVSHILTEHHAQIRVEDNVPTGARFVVEFPVRVGAPAPRMAPVEGELKVEVKV